MERDTLLEELSKLGYPLLRIEEKGGVNKILAEVVENREPRLWQGFPIIFANCLKRSNFDLQGTLNALEKLEDKRHFRILVNLSLSLYKHLEINVENADKIETSDIFDAELYEKFLEDFRQRKELHILSDLLSTNSLVDTFRHYFKPDDLNIHIKENIKVTEFINMKEEFDLDFALSQLFSTKQKELLFKKLRGEKMTKTEREYFSRSVKKKILAIANPDLHRLAINLLRD